MKFLVDAQLPARHARFLNDAGHDALRTSERPDGNRTTDVRIAGIADDDGLVVVTQDRDFRDGHLLTESPSRLLVVVTGNITNAALLALFELDLDAETSARSIVRVGRRHRPRRGRPAPAASHRHHAMPLTATEPAATLDGLLA